MNGVDIINYLLLVFAAGPLFFCLVVQMIGITITITKIINYLLLVFTAGPNDWNSNNNNKVEPTITLTKIVNYLLLLFNLDLI